MKCLFILMINIITCEVFINYVMNYFSTEFYYIYVHIYLFIFYPVNILKARRYKNRYLISHLLRNEVAFHKFAYVVRQINNRNYSVINDIRLHSGE